MIFGGLNQCIFAIFRAGIKICSVLREHASLEQAVDVRLELHLDVILVDLDFFDHQIQVIAVKRRLFQNVVKYIHCRFRHAVDADDGVSFVTGKFDLVLNARDALRQLRFQLVVGFLQEFLLLRVLHDVADALTLGRFQLLLLLKQQGFQVFFRTLRFRNVGLFLL